MFAGRNELAAFLAASDVVVNVLPLTEQTHKILDAAAFDAMNDDACLINIGRAGTVDDAALCAALDANTLGGAVLDVHRQEPLPADSAMWDQTGLIVTPHISGFTFPRTASALIAANIERIRRGEEPYPVVDRSLGY